MAQLSNPQEWAASAIESFQTVQTGRVNLSAVFHGLEFLCRASMSPSAIDGQLQAAVRAELWRLAPIVSSTVDGSIPAERIYLVLGMASALLSPPADEFHIERLAHASMLAAELKALVLQRLLHERGNSLLRSMTIIQAWAAADHHAPRVLQ